MKAKINYKGEWEIEIFDQDSAREIEENLEHIKKLANDIKSEVPK